MSTTHDPKGIGASIPEFLLVKESIPTLKIFFAAFKSRPISNPQTSHLWCLSDNSFFSMLPQPEHHCKYLIKLHSVLNIVSRCC